MTIILPIQLLFVVLKLGNVLNWTWLDVFTPIIVGIAIWIFWEFMLWIFTGVIDIRIKRLEKVRKANVIQMVPRTRRRPKCKEKHTEKPDTDYIFEQWKGRR